MEQKEQTSKVNNEEITQKKSRKKDEKRNGNIQNKRKNSILYYIVILIFIAIMIYTCIHIINWMMENKNSSDVLKKISDNVKVNDKDDNNINSTEKYIIDFDNLKKINQDVVAWINVNGTDVRYPIVKTTDNEFYLTHSFDKSYNSAGWIFMDYRNNLDGKDKNIIVYGHNRLDGSMFSTLKNILTNDWQENVDNLSITFNTEKEKCTYKVFSVYKIEEEDYYITTDFSNDDEFVNFANTLKSRSLKNFSTQVTEKDTILTLSTCAVDNNYRIVLHAVKQ